ncbi:uncharacterized protein CANTADRAFT_43548 [Suhomyces tanzawaensis NRRL Y-17324]|uniref:GATA-type domain-containing protein n=1 Tax=Suhomyces tanzawaensis NRRL Y-17324 TaxID=984487 RepID=A0A1E4SSH8_9ASCO|nr:uncharacterized protein CANTADRAFT_43548 [Suhomyces tanzawaensis NRRL Y-17324]ODV82473.1 hypothetical protein CANTADRAFT_43548 [Suhomyces tanzawaensis NRRL Y-17324]
MSLLQPAMLNKQKFTSGHIRSRSYNELLNQFKDIAETGAIAAAAAVYKKRAREEPSMNIQSKRSRTAPPSPPSPPYESASSPLSYSLSIKPTKYSRSLRSRSLSPNKRFNPISPSHSPNSSPVSQPSQPEKIKLPGISSVLNSAIAKDTKLKPIAPTVSLDYFDTYKPNDENWRYELLDTINRGSKHFNLDQYNYLNKVKPTPLPLPSYKPSFDTRISSKIAKPPVLPSINQIHHSERKINFPYESSYTYLNKTYLNDVEKYPEYLELAQSLIQLSKPGHPQTAYEPPSPRHETLPPRQPPSPLAHAQVPVQTQPSPVPQVASYYSPPTSHEQVLQPPAVVTPTKSPVHSHKFIPISPQLAKKPKSDVTKSPPKQHGTNPRVCISCGSEQSPCWRPSWSIKEGQLCNSCGLRYKKTSARCLNKSCKKIPAKGEWSLMQSKGKISFEDGEVGHSCLECGWRVEVKN